LEAIKEQYFTSKRYKQNTYKRKEQIGY